MIYTNDDIKLKASELMGCPLTEDTDEVLNALCGAAAAELRSRLRRDASEEDMGELFLTAAALTALSMFTELDSGGMTGFSAGSLSVNMKKTGDSSPEKLRAMADKLLSAYVDRGGFGFVGV